MLEVTLTAEKVTKNTVRFREKESDTRDKVFPVIYIQKTALQELGSTSPETIKVTVEVV